MAFTPDTFDAAAFDVVTPALHKYTSDSDYWVPLKCLVEIYDNKGYTLLLSYDSFNPESNSVKLLQCSVTLGLTNTQFTLTFEDGSGVIDQNIIGLGNKVLVYAGREKTNLTLLFTGYSENRSPIILGNNVMNYEMSGYGENASLNDIIVNFKRASSTLTDIKDPNFPKRPDSKMVVFELVKDLFEDLDVRVTKDIILKDYLNLDITGISPLVTERLLSISQSMQELSAVLNFLTEVTGAYWNIENGKLYFEYPEIKHSGIILKNKPHSTDLAASTSYFLNQWRYTDSISKDDGFANRIFTTTATDTKSVANSMSNQGATTLFDRAIAVQVELLETRINTLAFIMSRIGDPFVPLPEDEQIVPRGGQPPPPPPPPPVTCPTGYHLNPTTLQCDPDVIPDPIICPTGYHLNTATNQCVLDQQPPPGGEEGQIDSYGIMWLVARGEQFSVGMSRDTADDDRWSGNITGLRQGAEATFIGRSNNIASDGHFAMKHGGSNHSQGDWESQRWYDTGLRENGDVQIQYEGPHPSNHDFTIPNSKQFIDNIGKGLEGNWIGLKWVLQTMVPNGSPENGGVRCRMWVDRNAINTTTNKPSNNWELVYDFIDGVDVEAVQPQDYQMPDEWDCEVRRSGTESHDIFGLGQVITDCGDGDVGLHVRRLGTAVEPGTPPPTENPVCPTGYHWDPVVKQCIKDVINTNCPTGYHWDTALQRCVLDTPPPGGEFTPFTFHICGDFRSGSEAVASGNNLAEGNPDLVLMTGDYAVGDASADEWCHEIMSMVDTLTAQKWGALGNHDDDSFLDVNFFENTAWTWTVIKNGVAFIGCDTIDENYQDADSRCQAAFSNPAVHSIMIMMHEGIWHPEGTSVSSDTVIDFHEAFVKYKPKLKMVVCGHTHVYGRMNPVDGILYVMNGIGGQSPSSGSTTPAPFHKINGILRCTLNADGSFTCISRANSGEAPNRTMDTFTIGANGSMPTNGVAVRPRSFLPLHERTIDSETNRPVFKSIKKMVQDPKKKCTASLDIKEGGKDHKQVRQVALQQAYENVGYYEDVENKITQSAPSQLEEQVVKGEIRIDNNNSPNGPVISQFKVDVSSLSSTADTIFVNDINIDASVLSPTGKYWIVMFPCGTSQRNTVLWHHNGNLSTEGKYSAFAKGESKSDLSDWQVSSYGPTYCHAVFAKLRRIQEYSDPQSINRFRLKEDTADADFLEDTISVAKMMQNILAIRGKPVRKYDINDVTLPLDTWFTPGQNITIVDDTGHHEESKNIFAEVQEVTYSWSTDSPESTIGTFRVRILPVGHLNWHREQFPAGD